MGILSVLVMFSGVVEGAPRQGIHARHGRLGVVGGGQGVRTRACRERPRGGADVRPAQDFQELGGGGELCSCVNLVSTLRT